MNATDSPQASCPARRWRMWWLAVPAVPLSVFAAVVGYDSLQAQQPLQVQQRNSLPFYPEPHDSLAPGPGFVPSPNQQRPVPSSGAPSGRVRTPVDPAREMADELRRLDPQSEDHQRKREILEKTVAEQFDRRHQLQQQQLEEAEKRLVKLQQDLARRADAKDQIVARRIIELLGETDPLRWEPAPMHTYPNPFTLSSPTQQAASPAPGSRTFAPVATPAAGTVPIARLSRSPAMPPPTVSLPPAPQTATPVGVATQEANRVAGELARCVQEINAKQVELRRLQQLYRRGTIPQAEPVRLAAEVEARRQQQKLLELQLDQLAEQTKLNIQHARQALENAEKHLQVAQEPLDDSNPTSHRQQQRDIAEAETKLLQALQQMASVEQQGEYLQRLRDSVGKVNQQEIQQPEDAEDSPDAEEAGDAAEAVAY